MTRRALILGLTALAALVVASQSRAQIFTDQFNSQWYTIVNAAAANNIADVRIFIAKRVNVNGTDSQGRTALSYAAELGNAQIAKELLDARASPDQRDKLGNVPLHWAANNGRIDALKVLLAAHATVDAPDRQGITPLMSAIAHNQLNSVKALLAGGADPRKQDFTGRDAFGWAAGQPMIVQVLQSPAKP
ncbi:MAG TPA: ankyrin repeat domain-containing protein [Stellaceae bacterium]|nr:ankyrin repeat domain-containing protein [Stellaceae bacterium]